MQPNDSESISQRGSSQSLLLGVLAALLAVFGYLYFFTGVIRQHGEAPQPPAASQQQVKQPLPPRPGSPSTPKAAEAPVTASNAAPPQATQPPAPAKPPTQLPKPAEPQQKPQTAAPKPVPPKAAQPATQPQKPVTPPATPAAAEKKQTASAPKVAMEKPAAAKPSAKEPQKKDALKKPPVAYRIVTADILSTQKADRIAEQLKKTGLASVQKETRLAPRPMNRLFVAEFPDRGAAGVELEKLRKSSTGAFILPSGGKYELYAGSYDREKGAESEKKRLESLGIRPTLQKTSVKLPSYHVTAQAKSKEMADESLKIIRKLGSDATADPAGK